MPLVITNAAGAAIPRISPYVVRVSFTLWQEAYPLGQWAASQGWKTAYTAVSDFIPGHDAEAAFTKGWTDAGLKMLGAVRFPTTNPDFAPFVQRIKDAKPDVAFIWPPAGSSRPRCSRRSATSACAKRASTSSRPRTSSPTRICPIWATLRSALSPPAPIRSPADRPANKAFLAAWNKEYAGKATPDFLSADGWDGMIGDLRPDQGDQRQVHRRRGDEVPRNWKTANSPRGPISIDPATRDIVQNVYMRKVEMKNGKLANVEFDTIPDVKDPWKEQNPSK